MSDIKDCVLCKIARGKLKSEKVYDGKLVYAIRDINPVSDGHTLVIPKEHYADIYEMPDPVLSEIMVVAKKIAEELKRTKGAPAVNLLNASGKEAQQSVFHFHLHVVPRFEKDGLDLWLKKKK
jgi:histidine triad (HIT) family protein